MPTEADDLDKLLHDVRKSIDENRQFLKTLLDDAADAGSESEQQEDKEPEAFEEL